MGKRKASRKITITENEEVNDTATDDNDIDIAEDEEDDDDDLPAAFTPAKQENFKRGDLVYARYPGYPYWPSVFYSYCKLKKQKKPKVYVYFFDEVATLITDPKRKRRIIPIHLSRLKRWCSGSERDEIIQKGSGFQNFLSGMEQAEEYSRKRALGKITNFFEYIVEETDHCNSDEENNENSEPMTPIKVEDNNDKEKEMIKSAKMKAKSLFKTKATNDSSLATNIISWITDNARPLLNDIAKGKIISHRHNTFIEGSQKDKDKLRWYSGFGELSEQSANDILDLLVSWYTEDHFGTNYKAISYVSDVWLPEAYIHALSNTKNISLRDAETEYLK